MAGKLGVAIRRQEAESRLLAAVAAIGDHTGAELDPLPTQGKDPDLLRALQLEAAADVMELAVGFMQGYEAATDGKLAALTAERDALRTELDAARQFAEPPPDEPAPTEATKPKRAKV
jgi:hypothetical protein